MYFPGPDDTPPEIWAPPQKKEGLKEDIGEGAGGIPSLESISRTIAHSTSYRRSVNILADFCRKSPKQKYI